MTARATRSSGRFPGASPAGVARDPEEAVTLAAKHPDVIRAVEGLLASSRERKEQVL